jgi:hypothetical protein
MRVCVRVACRTAPTPLRTAAACSERTARLPLHYTTAASWPLGPTSHIAQVGVGAVQPHANLQQILHGHTDVLEEQAPAPAPTKGGPQLRGTGSPSK